MARKFYVALVPGWSSGWSDGDGDDADARGGCVRLPLVSLLEWHL